MDSLESMHKDPAVDKGLSNEVESRRRGHIHCKLERLHSMADMLEAVADFVSKHSAVAWHTPRRLRKTPRCSTRTTDSSVASRSVGSRDVLWTSVVTVYGPLVQVRVDLAARCL